MFVAMLEEAMRDKKVAYFKREHFVIDGKTYWSSVLVEDRVNQATARKQ